MIAHPAADGIGIVGYSAELPAFAGAVAAAGMEMNGLAVDGAGNRQVMLAILSALSGLEAEVIEVRAGFEAVMAEVEAAGTGA
ncbi:MAG: hypothetical protein COV76_06785 [Candidatus Omnitrophica bacterium CG11_big_fil_rev_8_21_14_0_20_64_10]|nr:MAG: hypothetical protein COV76_06785 [Candidatus Omnitrophica bacterium CG11_big_fil_rev_8_21_14_0_20_64_10]